MIERLAGRIIVSSGWRRALAAFLSGAFATLTQPPFDIFIAGFVSFPILVWLIDGAIPREDAGPVRRFLPAAMVGWWFGFGYFVSGLWWIGAALLVDADQFAWALPLAVLGLPAFLALFYALATMVARFFWSDGLGRIFALAFGFALAEWLRLFLFTGFPWNAIGYAVMPTPLLMQSVAVLGLVGMSAFAVFVFSAPALLTGGRLAGSGIAFAVLLVAAHVGFGAWTLSRAPAIADEKGAFAVRIVQPSIPQTMKWDNAERRAIFDKLVALSETAPTGGKPKPDVIVWPETAVPYILTSTPEAMSRIGGALQNGQVLLTGAVREELSADGGEPRYYNSIFTIDERGEIVDTADKVHLVPFGEYLPYEHLLRGLGLQEVVEMPGGFTAGASRRALKVKDGRTFLPLICYEAIFPDELGYTGEKAGAIINVTNDGWYGDTPGPYQHFRQAQVRAVEQGLPLIRAANNGLSGVIDAYGRITAGLALDDVGVIDASLPSPRAPFWGIPPGRWQTVAVLLTLLVMSMAFRLSNGRRFH
ncbi:apolipoprotein N-acyltransferase [Ochrobactrum daejeonense]|uniref:Apolipoprotein N-acyltransferase n=1 Tax=Brucella daejeonensis TaxID=659015 RepID=A0A7W9ATM6_9HYPH|nr:apolipoprotein N-acyltransferase [Brucella daejeonensis]MBB5700385.1 apolipoprotein N-acyltransferase [Brucella daejeonensis]